MATVARRWNGHSPKVEARLKETQYEVFIRLITVSYNGNDYPVIDPEHYTVYWGDSEVQHWTSEDQQKYETSLVPHGFDAVPVVMGYYWKGRFYHSGRDGKEYEAVDKLVKSGLPKPPKPPEKIVVETKIIHNWGTTVKAMAVAYVLAIITQSYLMWQFATVYGG